MRERNYSLARVVRRSALTFNGIIIFNIDVSKCKEQKAKREHETFTRLKANDKR